MSASVISLSLEWDLKFFSSCRMLVLMSCHRKADRVLFEIKYCMEFKIRNRNKIKLKHKRGFFFTKD